MKTFMLILSMATTDPSRPTQSRVVYPMLSLEQCLVLKAHEYWTYRTQGSLRCEPMKQVG